MWPERGTLSWAKRCRSDALITNPHPMKRTEYDAEGLRDEAATAIEESPYTQTDVAEQLDVNRTSVNRAVNSTSPKFEKLRQRIVEHLRGGRVEKRVTFVHVEDK